MTTTFFDHLLHLEHTRRHFPAGALVFERDDPVHQYYAIQSGEEADPYGWTLVIE